MHLKAVALSAPMEEGRIALVVHHPQKVELFCKGSVGIQLGVGRPAATVVAGLAVLGPGCGHHLAVAIEPSQAELQGGLGLEGAPLLHQLVAYQRDLLLQVDGAGIEFGGGFKQGDRDGADALEDLPGHRAPALTLGQSALVHHQVVAVQRQLVSTEQAAAAQQQAHIAWGQLGRIVDPAHSMAALPQRRNQLWQSSIEPAATIAEQGETAGRQRQRFTA